VIPLIYIGVTQSGDGNPAHVAPRPAAPIAQDQNPNASGAAGVTMSSCVGDLTYALTQSTRRPSNIARALLKIRLNVTLSDSVIASESFPL
jgi:hypothetical protein